MGWGGQFTGIQHVRSWAFSVHVQMKAKFLSKYSERSELVLDYPIQLIHAVLVGRQLQLPLLVFGYLGSCESII